MREGKKCTDKKIGAAEAEKPKKSAIFIQGGSAERGRWRTVTAIRDPRSAIRDPRSAINSAEHCEVIMRRYFSIASFTALNCIFVSGSEIYNHVGGVLADQFVFAWLLMFAVTSIIALFSAYIGVTHGDVVIVFIDALIIAINISRLMYAGAYQEAEYYAKSVVLKSIDDHCAAPPDRSGVVICYRFDIYPSIRYIVAAAPPPPNAAANGGAYSSVDAITELHHRLSNKFPCRITEITHKFADTFYVSTACE